MNPTENGSNGLLLDREPATLTIPTDLRLLALMRTFIETVCRIGGCNESVVYEVVLAADEATNNVMRHAHNGLPDAIVQIQCYLYTDRIEIHVLDEGKPFDITAVPHMDPSELRPGGRGVYLMRAIMSELTCHSRAPNRGNRLRMVKRFDDKKE